MKWENKVKFSIIVVYLYIVIKWYVFLLLINFIINIIDNK